MTSTPARPGMPIARRELQVLRLMANGHTHDQISTALGIAGGTTRTHAQRILTKLGARGQAHAVALAFAGGVLGPADIGQTDGAEEACAAAHGAVQRLLVIWRRATPPPPFAPWWGRRLDELANAIRKDTAS